MSTRTAFINLMKQQYPIASPVHVYHRGGMYLTGDVQPCDMPRWFENVKHSNWSALLQEAAKCRILFIVPPILGQSGNRNIRSFMTGISKALPNETTVKISIVPFHATQKVALIQLLGSVGSIGGVTCELHDHSREQVLSLFRDQGSISSTPPLAKHTDGLPVCASRLERMLWCALQDCPPHQHLPCCGLMLWSDKSGTSVCELFLTNQSESEAVATHGATDEYSRRICEFLSTQLSTSMTLRSTEYRDPGRLVLYFVPEGSSSTPIVSTLP